MLSLSENLVLCIMRQQSKTSSQQSMWMKKFLDMEK